MSENTGTTAQDTNFVPSLRDGLDFTALSRTLAAAPPVSHPPVGDYAQHTIALAGIARLPRSVRVPLTRVAAALLQPVWRGKRFADGNGTNLWLSRRHPATLGDYVFAATQPRVRLDYDLNRNPRPFRRVTGELAELGPAIYLGAMSVRVGNRRIPLIYFTLEQ